MRVRLELPLKYTVTTTPEVEEMVKIMGDNVWAESALLFYAERDALIRNNKTAPKGMQKYINMVLDKKFIEAGWEGTAGCYVKNRTWIRFTFRHQMSLGSDILNSIKVCKKEGIDVAVIMAANKNTARIISPNDASAMTTFEKLENEMISLDGVIDSPIVVGELTQLTHASIEIESEIKKQRPRNKTITQEAR